MKPVVEIFEPRLFDGAVADEIIASAQERLDEKGRCSITLAGGSTPAGVYRAMSKPPRVSELTWSSIDLLLGDERWVPHNDDQSNYRMVQETLLSQLKGEQPQVYPVDTSCASPDEGAKRYAEVLERVAGAGEPKLDIVLLGIGEDGHTASLFPGSAAVTEEQKLCQAVRHPLNGTERVTLSPKVLFGAWRVFFIVKGEGKSAMMKRIIEGADAPQEIPARLFTAATGKVTFFLDSGAALQLK